LRTCVATRAIGTFLFISEFNKSNCRIIRRNKVIETTWRDLVVGDFVVLQGNERIPADILVISNSNDDGRCFMETSTLDGEKSLKPREAIKKEAFCRATVTIEENNIEAEIDLHMRLNIKHPSYILYEFDGHLRYYDQHDQLQTNLVGIDSKNLLLKGAKVKNTKWVIGLVLYTGKETKIQLNATTAKSKMTVMEKKLHKIVITIFVCQLAISIFSAFGRPLLLAASTGGFNYNKFLQFVESPGGDKFTEVDSVVAWMIDGFRYFLLLNTLIPISLVVSLEVVRLIQSSLTRWNYELHCLERNIPCKVNTSTVNEELGQIEYILTDKTGTLTQNKMVLQGVFIGDQVFGGEFSKKDGKVHYESFADKQKRNKRRILTALDEQFDHSLHNIMKTTTKVRLRKPVVVSNQQIHDETISVGSSKKSELSSKVLKVGIARPEPLEVPKLRTDSGESINPSPNDGIFPQDASPVRRHNNFFPETPIHKPKISNFQDSKTDEKKLMDPEEEGNHESTPRRNKSDHELREDKGEINLQRNIIKTGANSKYDHLPAITVTKSSSLRLDREFHLEHKKNDSGEYSLLSGMESFEVHRDFLEEPRLRSEHEEPQGAQVTFTSYQELISEFFLCAAVCHQCVVETEFNGDRTYQGPSPDEIAICKGIKKAGCEFIGSNSQGEAEVDLFETKRRVNIIMVGLFHQGISF
jgi:magnesium-transporting ATPase (P-type)